MVLVFCSVASTALLSVGWLPACEQRECLICESFFFLNLLRWALQVSGVDAHLQKQAAHLKSACLAGTPFFHSRSFGRPRLMTFNGVA